MTANELIRFVDVQKTYDGETLVVRNLNLAIRKGEFLTLLGPSGSGKTTTLLMLAGFERPTSGDIRLGDASLSKLPPHKRDFGMVFQDYALFPHMTVAQNVAFPLSVRRMDRTTINTRVTTALEMVALGGFGHRRPNQLSGGQQQRVALARALVFEPRLVLMDEPLGALDKQLREQMQLEIKHIQRQLGITVVYVTHDQQEALTMSDRIAVFNAGEIRQLGTPDEIYEHPKTWFVAQFVGENNRLPGRVVGLAGSECAVEIADGHRLCAMAVNVAGQGAATTLSVRPERVVIGDAAKDMPNQLTGRIEELIYQGDTTRVRVAVSPEIGSFIVKLPNARGRATLTLGEPIVVGFSVEDCRALDAV